MSPKPSSTPSSRAPEQPDFIAALAVLLMTAAWGFIAFLLAPGMREPFEKLGLSELPAPTELVLLVGRLYRGLWFVVIPAGIAAAWLLARYPLAKGRAWLDGGLVFGLWAQLMVATVGLVMPYQEITFKIFG